MMSIERDDDYTGEHSTESGNGQGSRPISQIGSKMGRAAIRGNPRSYRLDEAPTGSGHRSVKDTTNRT